MKPGGERRSLAKRGGAKCSIGERASECRLIKPSGRSWPRHVRMAKPRHHVIEASELVDGIGERLWPWTSLVEKLSEPSDGVMPAVSVSDDAGDNLAIEFKVVAAGREPDQSVGHWVPVKNRAAPINRDALNFSGRSTSMRFISTALRTKSRRATHGLLALEMRYGPEVARVGACRHPEHPATINSKYDCKDWTARKQASPAAGAAPG